ncbi:MAG: 5-formyltetrahydrofolate cyclo-ligase [Alphaproteobacteria bacterium]
MILEQKKQIRADMLKQRVSFASKSGSKASLAIAEKILEQFIKGQKHKVFSLYFPIKGEVDISSLMFDIEDEKSEAALPVVEKKGEPLIFARWSLDTVLTTREFGILEPSNVENVVPDVMFLPLVAFDRQGNRLGYGGGYYDKTIAKIKKIKPQVKIVGVGYAMQEVATIPCEEGDEKMAYIVTEKEVIKIT